MRMLLQKVLQASVTVEGELVGKIDLGYLLYVGVLKGDTVEQAQWLVDKIANLRLYPKDGKEHQTTIVEQGGAILAVSQFTLAAHIANGNRPDFADAMPASDAKKLYEDVVRLLREKGIVVAEGRFQAHMEVTSVNDGPYTLMLER